MLTIHGRHRAVDARHQRDQLLLLLNAAVNRQVVRCCRCSQIGIDEAGIQRNRILIEGNRLLPVYRVELRVEEFAMHETLIGQRVLRAPVLHACTFLFIQMNLQSTDDVGHYRILYGEKISLGHVEAARILVHAICGAYQIHDHSQPILRLNQGALQDMTDLVRQGLSKCARVARS